MSIFVVLIIFVQYRKKEYTYNLTHIGISWKGAILESANDKITSTFHFVHRKQFLLQALAQQVREKIFCGASDRLHETRNYMSQNIQLKYHESADLN